MAHIEVPQAELTYGQQYYFDTTTLLPQWGHFINFETMVMDTNGHYQPLANHAANSWLSNNDGVLSGSPGLDDIPPVPLSLRVIADDGLGNKAIIELSIKIDGPVAIPQKPIEAVSGETRVIQLANMFGGFEISRYEYRIIPLDADGNDLPITADTVLPEVVSFNEQTGRLELQLGDKMVGNYRIDSTAIGVSEPVATPFAMAMSFGVESAPMTFGIESFSTNETITRSSSVLLNSGPRATEEHYAYQYDEAGRVTRERLDGINSFGAPVSEDRVYVYDDLGRVMLCNVIVGAF
ncbi:hypothetical protein [Colwellia sp. MEBiC06753]